MTSDWTELGERLAATFRSVSDRVFLIVASRSTPVRYVQLAGGPGRIDAEAPATDVVADADESVLSAAGWTAPGIAQPNWTASTALPALTAEYRALALRCVNALRDAYGIGSPDDLGYRAWREPEQMPAGRTWSAERLQRMDRGVRALELPTLGLDANRPRTPGVSVAPALRTWKAMSPSEVRDLMEYWAARPWPLSRDEVQRLAVERFGWTIEVEDGTPYLMNTVSGFTVPDVSTIGAHQDLNYLSLRTSDVIRQVTPESTAFLGDGFTRMVRAGEAGWGRPAMHELDGTVSATWDLASGAQISFRCAPSSLSAMFRTPQGVALDLRSEG
ncbi:DUF6301 family protein [Oerskovia enterophila]|uniref:TY-Chap N-terminal domain-containing protein n=1 Tax=Oerskovia enterophila TaxID=43678 RepID=A0A163RGR2_9CELL|nr:DUF6301 family protein [Oerskovia enterophila]KZM35196.1 hypothetical protein OJAG_21640 [Oerskovia enterophila]OCI30588.1 hypothetical protein OERS_27510 [Oerskovia enterophila]